MGRAEGRGRNCGQALLVFPVTREADLVLPDLQACLPPGATEQGGSRNDPVTLPMTKGRVHTGLPDSDPGLSPTLRLSVKAKRRRFHWPAAGPLRPLHHDRCFCSTPPASAEPTLCFLGVSVHAWKRDGNRTPISQSLGFQTAPETKLDRRGGGGGASCLCQVGFVSRLCLQATLPSSALAGLQRPPGGLLLPLLPPRPRDTPESRHLLKHGGSEGLSPAGVLTVRMGRTSRLLFDVVPQSLAGPRLRV